MNIKGYSIKFLYKEIDGNYSVGLKAFIKNGRTLGLKPSLSISSVHISAPITLGIDLSYASFALKVIFGAMALAGLLFYKFSDEDEDDIAYANQVETKSKRYNEHCLSLNKTNRKQFDASSMESELKRSGLVILAAYFYDRKYRNECKASILQAYDTFKRSQVRSEGIVPSDLGNVMKGIQEQVEQKEVEDKLANITNELNNRIFLSSLCFKVSDFSESSEWGMPLNHESSAEVSMIYLLNNSLIIGSFTHLIKIGRSN